MTVAGIIEKCLTTAAKYGLVDMAELCFWMLDTWERKSWYRVCENTSAACGSDNIQLQFSSDQLHFLLVHETQLVRYDYSNLANPSKQPWFPERCPYITAPISCAVYSRKSELVFVGFRDGSIGIFEADILRLRCLVAPSAYLSNTLNSRQCVYPVSIAANPKKKNQMVVGLTDGSLKVIASKKSENGWGVSPPPSEYQAIWRRDKLELTDEKYIKLYRSLDKDVSEEMPLSWYHFSVEGDTIFKAVLFVPPTTPRDLYESYYKSDTNIKLYLKGPATVTSLTKFGAILPKYLNFLKGVVEFAVVSKIVTRKELLRSRSILIEKSLQMIHTLADEDPDESSNDIEKKDVVGSSDCHVKKGQYRKFWNEFGRSIKLGIIEDVTNRMSLAKLVRFESTKSDGNLTSLEQYISRMKSDQKDILYITGISQEKNSPILESLTNNGYEVIFFTHAIDGELVQYLSLVYQDNKFCDVSDGLTLGQLMQ